MNAYSQIYTKATDFIGSVKGNVDPRTGQFTISISLGMLIANNGLGPHVPLNLSYSPMNQTDLGFGAGFGFGFTNYDQRSTILSLSSGSQYKVLESDDSVVPLDAKLKEVSFEKIKGEYYKVMYRDGSFELLTKSDTANTLKVPYKIVSAQGHFITLNWAYTENQWRLLSIVDENGSKLVSITYPGALNATAKIAVLPDRQTATANSPNPEGYNVYLFYGDNRHLTKIRCDADEGLEWGIGYTNLDCLGSWGQIASSVTYPGGFTEFADYAKCKGHRFPAMRADMQGKLYPYVRTFTKVPGAGQPMVRVNYKYDLINSHNFLGYAAPGIFARNPTLDALYNCSDGSYRYHTLETHFDDHNVETRIERSYNCFHQLVEQKRVKQNCSVVRSIEYYSIPGIGFEAQPGNFQCRKSQTMTLSDTNSAIESRAIENTDYDVFGNINSKSGSYVDVNGNKTDIGKVEYVYYPANVETSYDASTGFGCPLDPNSFNRTNNIPRFIKSLTITPHQFYGDEQPKQTRYSYTLYNVPQAVTNLLANTDPDHGTYAVFKSEERIYHAAEALQETTTYSYANNAAVLAGTSMSEFGQLLATVDTHYPNDGVEYQPGKPETKESFATTTTSSLTLTDDALTTRITTTTWDQITTSTSSTASRFTGRVTEEADEMGVKTQATYDALGRVTKVTTAVGSNYEDSHTLTYAFGTAATIPYTITVTDILSNQAKTSFDGVGKGLAGSLKLNETGAIWQTMQERQYDSSGRLKTTTNYDYKDCKQETPYSTVTSTPHYDDWGRVDYVTGIDGIKHFNIINPILLTKTIYSQGKNGSPETGRVVQQADVARCSINTLHYTSATAPTDSNSLYSISTDIFDGWKQLREARDELGRVTKYSYDYFGRVTKTILPELETGKLTIVPTGDSTPIADGVSWCQATANLTLPTGSPGNQTVQFTTDSEFASFVVFEGDSVVVGPDGRTATAQTNDQGETPPVSFVSGETGKVALIATASSFVGTAQFDFIAGSSILSIHTPASDENAVPADGSSEYSAYALLLGDDPGRPVKYCLPADSNAIFTRVFDSFRHSVIISPDGKTVTGCTGTAGGSNWAPTVYFSNSNPSGETVTLTVYGKGARPVTKAFTFDPVSSSMADIRTKPSVAADSGHEDFACVVTTNLTSAATGGGYDVPADGSSQHSAYAQFTGNASERTVKYVLPADSKAEFTKIDDSNATFSGDMRTVLTSTGASGGTKAPTVYFSDNNPAGETVTLTAYGMNAQPAKHDFTFGSIDTVLTHTYSRYTAAKVLVGIQVGGVSMGTRTVDGLGRISRQMSGGRTWTATYDKSSGSLTSPSTVTSPYKRTVKFQYEPQLGGKLKKRSFASEGVVFVYSTKSDNMQVGLVDTALSSVGSNSNYIKKTYDVAGRLLKEEFSGGLTAMYQYTVAGKVWSYKDNVTHAKWEVKETDSYGRPTKLSDENCVQLTLSYDALGRTSTWTTTDLPTKNTLTTTLTWDALDREYTRRFDSATGGWLVEQEYYPNNQCSKRTLKRGQEWALDTTFTVTRTEAYVYDARNRLSTYTISYPDGRDFIKDGKGNTIMGEAYDQYDVYNNIVQLTTTFAQGDPDTANFAYDTTDPTQLISISHTRQDLGASMSLTYDEFGGLKTDDEGRNFTYDQGVNCGYITSVDFKGEIGSFQYDAFNRLINENGTSLFYRGSTLAVQKHGNDTVRLIHGPSGLIAQVNNEKTVWLNGAGLTGSILSTEGSESPWQHYDMAYGSYGEQSTNSGQTPSILGYNGERKSDLLNGYQLGNGYRLYKPSLRRFTSPDSMSPFGKGGINPYAYCEGDPINNTDPTGHFPILSLFIGIGLMALDAVPGVGEVAMGAEAGAAVAAGGEVAADAAAAGIEEAAAGGAQVVIAAQNLEESKMISDFMNVDPRSLMNLTQQM
ncbi:hypothetical protein AVM02_03085 [Brucella anthropi]|uniref:RHS repeat-associated core domain-containing protein n=1 Tax=Brucella anthropi TaxID=529 RepID=UPI00398649D0